MSLSEAYAESLRAHGLIATNDSEGKLRFKYEGDHYVLQTYIDDWEYISISATYRLPTGVRQQRALTEAHKSTASSKIAKVYVLPDRAVTIAVEQLVRAPADLESFLIRLIRIVQSVASDYFSHLSTSGAVSP